MDNPEEVVPPQNPAPVPPPQGDETVTLPKKEVDDLRHRADVSSQNFERAKKAEGKVEELEQKLETLLDNPNPSGADSELIREIQGQLREVRSELSEAKVIKTYPKLEAVWSDFEAFRNDPENKGMNVMTAAKAFLTEKGLLSPKRDGLEPPSGGRREPPQAGMTVEDVKHLRETNFKKYREMVQKGLINP